VESIQSLQYPGARQLFVYVKGEHLNVVPGLREFLQEYARGWAPNSYLQDRGLIPAPDDIRAAAGETVQNPRPLLAQDLG
jgi:phosphate transport system substrate-binding protein